MGSQAPAVRVSSRRIRLDLDGLRSLAPILLGSAVIAVMLLAAVFLPLPYSPVKADPLAITLPPSGDHLFGTDANGFDVFSRTIASAKRDLPIALLSTVGAMLIGVPLALVASASRFGEALMRFADAFAVLPMTMVAVVAVQLIGGGVPNLILVLMIFNIPPFMRVTRGEAMSIRASRYVEAAVSIGCSRTRVALNHVLRNAYGVVLVQASLAAAISVVAVAAMSFLGVGISPPTPTWGSMIQDGTVPLVQGEWWVVFFPACAVFLAVSSLNLIATGIEKRFEGER